MDQIKIGKFIAQMRKDQGLTQRQLAELLSISDMGMRKRAAGSLSHAATVRGPAYDG